MGNVGRLLSTTAGTTSPLRNMSNSTTTTRQGRLTRMPVFEESRSKYPPRPLEDVWALATNVTTTEDEELNPPYDPSTSPTYAQRNEEL